MTFLRRPLRWLDAVSELHISYTGAPNFGYAACTRAARQAPAWRSDLSRVRALSCGAEPINAQTVTEFNATFAPQGLAPNVFMPAYGLAEATLAVTARQMRTGCAGLRLDSDKLNHGEVELAAADDPHARTVVSCGAPLLDVQTTTVDPTTRAALQESQVGEIWVSGPGVALGYWNKPAETSATFGQALPDDSRRFLRTGGLGLHAGWRAVCHGQAKRSNHHSWAQSLSTRYRMDGRSRASCRACWPRCSVFSGW